MNRTDYIECDLQSQGRVRGGGWTILKWQLNSRLRLSSDWLNLFQNSSVKINLKIADGVPQVNAFFLRRSVGDFDYFEQPICRSPFKNLHRKKTSKMPSFMGKYPSLNQFLF